MVNTKYLEELEEKGELRLHCCEIEAYKKISNKKDLINKILEDIEHVAERYLIEEFELQKEFEKFIHNQLNKLSEDAIMRGFADSMNLEIH